MDITNFMQWFIDQVVSMFTYFFNLLDSITFMGTSLLRVIITISILIPLMSVLLTISKNGGIRVSKSERVRERSEDNDN